MKIITIGHDHDNGSPSDWGGWKLYSFCRRHTSHRDPEEFFPDGKPTLAVRNKLRAGTAFLLSYYEHGRCMWSLAGTGPQCQWDTVQRAGILMWEGEAKPFKGTYAEREKDAECFLDTYTSWCNGEVYWYKVEEVVTMPCGHTEIRDVPDASCGGFYGLDHMKEEIMAALDGDTDVSLKGDAAAMFDKRDFAPKEKATEEHTTH
jgi:hypothetical protein